LDIALVSGYSLVPLPPARIIPFMVVLLLSEALFSAGPFITYLKPYFIKHCSVAAK